MMYKVLYSDRSGIMGEWEFNDDFQEWMFKPCVSFITEENMKIALEALEEILNG